MKLVWKFLFFSIVAAPFVFPQETREIDKSVSLNANGRLVIDTYKGTINISTWDKSEVEIHARIEADDQFWGDHSEEDVRDTEVRISGSGNEVRIKSDYGRLRSHHDGFFGIFEAGGSQPFVHYTITMPKTAELRIKDYKSKTSISDLQADVEINTYKGEVDIKNLTGSVDLETYKGDVDVRFSKLARGSRFETYKGKISILLPKKTGFELESDFGRKTDFDSDFDVSKRYRGKKKREADYYGSFNGGGPKLQLKSEKGSFSIRQS